MSRTEEVRRQILEAFPPLAFTGDIGGGPDEEDCPGLEEEFVGKRWDEISDEVMAVHFESITMLSDEALPVFLPAWLMRSLEELSEPEHFVRQWALYELGAYDTVMADYQRRRYRHFNEAQREAVGAFLGLMMAEGALAEPERESIQRAYEMGFWPQHSG